MRAQRRRLLCGSLALLAGPLAARLSVAATQPTPAQALGPYYPRVLPADRDNDLVQIRGHPRGAQGTVVFVDGRVTDPEGRPVDGALIEIWQCDVYGRYLPPADAGGGARDEDFQGYGQAKSDAAGAYGFRTIRPVPYAGRPPHIHYQVTHPRYRRLVTQLYAQEAGSTGGRWSEGAYPSLWVTFEPTPREPGALAARFDLVLVAER